MVQLHEHVSLAKYANYRIGGPARYFFAPQTVEELKEAITIARSRTDKIFILGGGTNLLISDEGFDGAVIKPELRMLEVHGTDIHVGAGVLMSEFVEYASNEGFSGLEWAGGLPGTVGGAIRGNAGAFGGETKDNVRSVRTVNLKTLEERTCTNEECAFGYRTSIFKQHDGDEVIVSAVFSFTEGDAEQIRAKVQEHIDYRTERHPLEYPNIGSTFKNVPVDQFDPAILATVQHVVKNDPFPVVPVAYLISECGLKEASYGGAMVSGKHPNFIVNVHDAKASDVLHMIDVIKEEVMKKFHVVIEEEVMKI